MGLITRAGVSLLVWCPVVALLSYVVQRCERHEESDDRSVYKDVYKSTATTATVRDLRPVRTPLLPPRPLTRPALLLLDICLLVADCLPVRLPLT